MCILSVISGIFGSRGECSGVTGGSCQSTGSSGLENTNKCHRGSQFSGACGVLSSIHSSICTNCCSSYQPDEEKYPLYVVPKGGGGLHNFEGSFATSTSFAAGRSEQGLHLDSRCQRFCHRCSAQSGLGRWRAPYRL